MLLDIREYGEQFNGRDYDLQFRWSDDLMYCSELAWKLYKEGAGIELCAKNKVKNLKLDSKEVERIASKRYTNGFADVPMTEHIVTTPLTYCVQIPLLKFIALLELLIIDLLIIPAPHPG